MEKLDKNMKAEFMRYLLTKATTAFQQKDWAELERSAKMLKELAGVGPTLAAGDITRVPTREVRKRGPRGVIGHPLGTVLAAHTRKGDLLVVVRENGLEYEGELYANFSALGKAISGGKTTHLQQRKFWKPEGMEVVEEDDRPVTVLRKRGNVTEGEQEGE